MCLSHASTTHVPLMFALCHVCGVLDKCMTTTTAAALVSSPLGYANSTVNSSPSNYLDCLHCIQNSLARALMQQTSLSLSVILQQLQLRMRFTRISLRDKLKNIYMHWTMV